MENKTLNEKEIISILRNSVIALHTFAPAAYSDDQFEQLVDFLDKLDNQCDNE